MIKWAKVNPNAVIPTRKDENAGYDIYACFDGDLMVLPSGSITMVHTGIASSFESDKYFQIQERGSTGSIGLKYCAGVIDSGFRGEWVIILYNANPKDIIICIAGFILGPIPVIGVSVAVSFLEMITISQTGFYGFIMNIISTCAFVVPAALIYKSKKSFKGALLSLLTGFVSVIIVMTLWNIIITPIYMGIEKNCTLY